jgi:hypothetical protein
MKFSYCLILLSFLFVQCSEPVQDDSKDEAKEKAAKEAAIEKNNVKAVDKLPTHRFRSTETGVEEYMTMRQNAEGVKEWFYSSAANPKDVKLGVTSKNGKHAVYFMSKPQVLYVLDLDDCGFMLTDEEGETQWYRQVEPEC